MDLFSIKLLLIVFGALAVGLVLGSRYRGHRCAGKSRVSAMRSVMKKPPVANLAGGPPAPRPGP